MLSIIIPAYNAQDTIGTCINSILKLKDINYELIIIDDGSRDKTPLIINKYSHLYSNIHALHQQNLGISAARNNGIRHSKGKWICFIDSDDYIDSNVLAQIIFNYYNSNVDLIQSNFYLNKKIIGIRNNFNKFRTKSFLLKNYPLYGNLTIQTVWSKLFKSSVIKNNNIYFPTTTNIGEDLIFNLKYFSKIKLILQINLPFYHYTIHSYSITNKFELNPIKSKLMILKNVNGIISQYNLPIKALNWLNLKASYSILLNALRAPKNKLYLIKRYKKAIFKYHLISNNYRYKRLESYILTIFIKQPSILILFIILIIINKLKNYINFLTNFCIIN